MWHAIVARPPAWQTFFHARKKIFETFLIGWIPYIARGTILEKHFWRSQAQGQWSHKAMTCACGMYVHCTLLHTCPLALLAHANFAPPCQRESQNIPIFEIKECNIVRTHSCDSKEAKMRSRNALSDCNQQNPIFKYQ